MFDIGWSELLVIGIVALIVVGPQDLPRMFAALGRFTAKAKAMGREFQRAMDDAAKDSGMADTAKDLRNMTSKKSLGLDKIEEAAKKFEKWEPVKPGAAKSAAPGSETAKLAERRAAESEARKAATEAPAEPAKARAPKAPAAKKPAAARKAPAAKAPAPKAAAPKAAAAKSSATKSTARKAPTKKSPAGKAGDA